MASIIQSLDESGLTYQYLDDEKAQLMIFEAPERVVKALRVGGWLVKDARKLSGGLFCSGELVVLRRGQSEIKLINSASNRTQLWKA